MKYSDPIPDTAADDTADRPAAAMEFRRTAGRPLYKQLGDHLRSRVVAGQWGVHEPLPPEARISEMYSVSPCTVRQAMGMLVKEGLLVRERGRGTFVRPSAGQAPTTASVVKHHRIGLVMPWDRASFFSALAPDIEDQAHRAGFRMMLVNNQNDPETELERVRETVDHGVDGLIWMCSGNGPKPTAVRYAREKAPAVVMIDRVPPAYRSELSLVDADNRGGMNQMVDYLVSRGRRRIAFAASQRHLTSTRNRERGYRRGLRQAGIELQESWVFGTRQIGLAGGRILARKVLASGEKFDAICCSSDAIAAGLIQELQSRGLRVPDDVAVTGFDDDPMFSAVKPGLTTVHMDLQTMALEATRLLLEQLDRLAQQQIISVKHVSVPVRLVVRESA